MASQKANAYYADMAGKPRLSYADVLPQERAMRKPRAPRKPSTEPLESDILKSIMQYLRLHPKVAWVCRMNSGMFQDGNRYIRANSQRGMSDILFMLHGGRMGACEVKRHGANLLPHQADFLYGIRDNGGIGFVARSIVDVAAQLKNV